MRKKPWQISITIVKTYLFHTKFKPVIDSHSNFIDKTFFLCLFVQDEDQLDESGTSSLQSNQSFQSDFNNHYHIFNNENNPNDINTAVVHRRKSKYNLCVL